MPGRPAFRDLLFPLGHITASHQVRLISYKLLLSAAPGSLHFRLVTSETEVIVKEFSKQLKIPGANGWAW